ncbi:MAG: hypothetical protein AAFW46_16250, partial [Pseudomonadota bacterium]
SDRFAAQTRHAECARPRPGVEAHEEGPSAIVTAKNSRDDRRGGRGRDRDDRGPRGDRDDRGPRGDRDDRGPRGDRDDRGPRGDRGDREDRRPREAAADAN